MKSRTILKVHNSYIIDEAGNSWTNTNVKFHFSKIREYG